MKLNMDVTKLNTSLMDKENVQQSLAEENETLEM